MLVTFEFDLKTTLLRELRKSAGDMRLEDRAIAKMRDRMSQASITELIDIKKETKKSCKCGNDQK